MAEETRSAVRAMEAQERRDRVLIVEDEDNARKGYEQLLQRWGCDVLGVGTAEDALAKFASYWVMSCSMFPPSSLPAKAAKNARWRRLKPERSGTSRSR
jgi:PleD family two-component response regulator